MYHEGAREAQAAANAAWKRWAGHKTMLVIGCIDAHGAIIARRSDGTRPSHEHAESRGKRWRWNVWRQQWGETFLGYELSEEEKALVMEWLIRHNLADNN